MTEFGAIFDYETSTTAFYMLSLGFMAAYAFAALIGGRAKQDAAVMQPA